MRFSSILPPSPLGHTKPRGRRARCECLPELERLEVRTPLSAGTGPSLISGALALPSSALANLATSTAFESTRSESVIVSQVASSGTRGFTPDFFPRDLLLAAGEPLSLAPREGSFFPTAFDGPVFYPPSSLTPGRDGPNPAGSAFLIEFFAQGGYAAGGFIESAAGNAVYDPNATPSDTPDPDNPGEPGTGGDANSGDDSVNYPPAPPVQPYPLALPSGGGAPRPDLNTIEYSVNFAGPLSPTSTNTSPVFMMPILPASTGHAAAVAQAIASGANSTQTDLLVEGSPSGWMPYVAAGGWSVPSFQAPSSSGDAQLAAAESSDLLVPPLSRVNGDAPVSLLLSGPDVPAEAGSSSLEQVAELVPLDESSLALAATLWTVSADAQVPSTQQVGPSESLLQTTAASTALPTWMGFITGLERAFEQSCRGFQPDTSASFSRPARDQAEGHDLDDGVFWNAPIFAAPMGGFPAAQEDRGGLSARAAVDRAIDSVAQHPSRPPRSNPAAGAGDDIESKFGERVPVLAGAGAPVTGGPIVPTLTAVSVSAVAVGWFWARHRKIAPDARSRSTVCPAPAD